MGETSEHKAYRRKELLFAWVKRFHHIVPWISLCAGIVGALLMDRSPRASVVVFVCSLLSWGAVFLLGRLLASNNESTLPKMARVAVTWATQSLMQQCLFFVLPFYVLSASFFPGHVFFLICLAAVSAMTLWDPLFDRIVSNDWQRVLLQAMVAFVTMNVAAPVLGASNRMALIVAAATASAGAPLYFITRSELENRTGIAARSFAVSFGVIVTLSLLGASVLIPPAPLRVISGGIGVGMDGHTLVGASATFDRPPASLYCASAIKAPRPVKDELFHIWSQDGKVTDRIPLRVRGGRRDGFRTHSKKSKFRAGVLSCRVETASGQVLHVFSARVKEAPTEMLPSDVHPKSDM